MTAIRPGEGDRSDAATNRGEIEIIDVEAQPHTLDQFIALPREIYQRDQHYIATPPASVLAGLSRPAFAGRQRVLLALEGGRPVARVVARRSPTLVDQRQLAYGMLGFFEALDRPSAVQKLFATAISWLRQEQAGEILGPMDGDTWHKYRLNLGPFDTAPFLLEPYNPPYYQALWEVCGFRPLEQYYSTLVRDAAAPLPRLLPILRRVEARGYRLEPFRASAFESELRRIYDLSRAIFAGNFLYEDIAWSDFLDIYRPTRPLLDADLIWFARGPSGNDAGFLFCFPDHFDAVAALRGRRGPLARLKYLWRKRGTTTVNFKTLGVMDEHRKTGLGAALTCRGYQQTLAKGYRRANLCLIREGNPSGRMEAGAGALLRRYTLYSFQFSQTEH